MQLINKRHINNNLFDLYIENGPCNVQWDNTADTNKITISGWVYSKQEAITSVRVVFLREKKEDKIEAVFPIERQDIFKKYSDQKGLNSGFKQEISLYRLRKSKVCIELKFENNSTHMVYIGNIGMGIFGQFERYYDKIKKNGIKEYIGYLNANGLKKYLNIIKNSSTVVQDGSLPSVDINELIKSRIAINNENIELIASDIEITPDVIVPVYNGFDYLSKLFSSIKKTRLKFRLIVVDDCSTDERVKPFLYSIKEEFEDYLLIENEKNEGFLPSVNKALVVCKNHVAIVNTDTELPSNWLERLINPFLIDKSIASTTPYTNSGTIFSFPNFGVNNLIFEDLSVEELDSNFREIVPKYESTPTGVGFCMGMNYDVIKEIGIFDEEAFGKGYGEENDWCQRAIKHGYKNVHVENLFVYHKHGGSFTSEEKTKLNNEHLKILAERYPNYSEDVANYCRRDLNRNIRELILMKYYCKNGKTILVFNHKIGGGATSYLERKIEEENAAGNAVIIVQYNYEVNIFEIHFRYNQYCFDYKIDSIDSLANVIKYLSVCDIWINNLYTYRSMRETLDSILRLKENIEGRIIFLFHDLFSICPSVDMVDENRRYCSMSHCNNCVESCYMGQTKIDEWREIFRKFLSTVDEVRTFSNNTKSIVESVYGVFDNLTVVPHVVDYMPSFSKQVKTSDTINIGLLGNLSINKGYDIVKQMVEYIDRNHLNVKIKLIGSVEEGLTKFKQDIFSETGKYTTGMIPRLTFEEDIDVFLIPSVWPETFSYTSEEIMCMNYPIACFKIGAPAERISKYEKGLLISEIDGNKAVEEIVRYYHNNRLISKDISNKKKVLCVAEYISFSSRYRLDHYREELIFKGIQTDFVEVKDIDDSYINYLEMSKYESLFIYRCRENTNLTKLINKFKSNSLKVYYDIDDYIFNYDDIKNLDFLKGPEYANFDEYSKNIKKCMDLCDTFMTSTEMLKSKIKEEYPKKEVIVNRNVASIEMLIESLKAKNIRDKRKQTDKIVIGYFSGSNTHNADFDLISDSLLELMEINSNIHLLIGGCLELDKRYEKYCERIEKAGFVDWRELPKLISRVDINLMPVEDTVFHWCKSENKWMEAGLVGVVTIASRNPELEKCIEDGVNGVLFSNESEFLDRLKYLISEKKYRMNMSKSAHDIISKQKKTYIY